MRYFELFEYNLQNLISTFRSKVEERLKQDRSTKAESLEQLLTQIEEPLKKDNKKQIIDPYMKWIISKYASGKIPMYEDIESKVIPYLFEYDKLKRKKKLKPEHKDINKFKSYKDLMDAVDSYDNQTQDLDSDKEIENKFYENKEATLIYNGPQVKVVVPHTERASCFFGRNTKWCTAATKGNNYFSEYNKRGNLYVVLIKKENERYQFHYETNQFLDSQDEKFDLIKLADKYPILWDIFTPIAEKHESIVLNKNASEQKQLAAVELNSRAIRYIRNPSEEVQLAAAEKDSSVIHFIDNPSEQVQLAAVNQSGLVIEFIDNPSEQVQLAAIKRDDLAFRFIRNPSERVQMAAVNRDRRAIQYIDNPSEQVQLAAVNQNWLAIKYIRNPSEQVQIVAVKQNCRTLQYIDNPSEQVQLAAVNQDGLVIEFIDNPSKQVQLAAVKENGRAIKYIKNPSERVKKMAGVKS